MRLIAIVAVAILLAGCAAQRPQMTRAQYLEMTQRTYADKSPDDVFAAAEKLFRLADGDDFSFSHSEDSMVATRPWLVYVILAATMGTDSWTVRARETAAGTNVHVALNTSMGNVLPIPTTGGDMTVGGMPSMAGNVQGTAIYDVFWARMDYLLGKTDHWMTCKEADERVKTKVTWGSNEALCNSVNLKDELPEELRPKKGT